MVSSFDFWLIYVIIGVFAGILGGLLGIGGGLITVPCLFSLFTALQFPEAYRMKIAIATSLAAMVFNTAASVWAHQKQGKILWNLIQQMLPGVLIGSVVGAIIASVLTTGVLQMIFGSFAILLGVYMFIKELRKQEAVPVEHRLPRPFPFNLIFGSVAGLSNMLGIGGGIITVPILTFFQVQQRYAIATSAMASFMITTLGAISYFLAGLRAVHTEEVIGYLDLPAFTILAITTFFTAPYGAWLTQVLPSHRLRQIFAGALVLTGFFMVSR